MVQSVIVTKAVPAAYRPPPTPAEFPEMVQSVIVAAAEVPTAADLSYRPPPLLAEFPEMVLSVIVTGAVPMGPIPPPTPAEFPEMVLPVMVAAPGPEMPPPLWLAELPVISQSMSVTVPR